MSETAAAPLIDSLGLIAGDGPAMIRSLFLWQQIMGPASGAGQRLARVLDPLLGLPVGADVTPHVVSVPATPDGPVLVTGCVPNGDVLFEGIAEDGMSLAGSIDPVGDGRSLRRFQLRDAGNRPCRGRGGERVILRYTLPPPALVARQLMFAALTRRPVGTPPDAVLRVWVVLEQGGAALRVDPSQHEVGAMTAGETLHMAVYARHALLAAIDRSVAVTARLMVELIARPISVELLGEALVISG